jgi:hypothetical protein
MKIKVTQKTEVVTELDIEFPIFGQFISDTFVKVVSPDSYIKASCSLLYGSSIDVVEGLPSSTSIMIGNALKSPITESEFNKVFIEALAAINSLLPELSAPTLERHY